jgi:hypothetical protein
LPYEIGLLYKKISKLTTRFFFFEWPFMWAIEQEAYDTKITDAKEV